MAVTTTVTKSCDMPEHRKEVPGKTYRFGVDGAEYEMELCDAHRAKFSKMGSRYARAARRAGQARPGRRTEAMRRRSRAIRAWAVEQGIGIPPQGRIPVEVIRRYDERAEATA